MNNCSGQPPVFSIFTGDAKLMNLSALYANFGGPLDLTSCTEIVISLPSASGIAPILLKLTEDEVEITSPPVLGKFSVPADEIGEISDDLNVGELQSFSVQFTIGADIFTVPYINALSVFEAEP